MYFKKNRKKDKISILLSNNKKILIPKSLIKWTQQAKECFLRDCKCFDCEINKAIETPCFMKHIVKIIYEKHGLPPQNIDMEDDK